MSMGQLPDMRYEFGRNWSRFVDNHLSESRIVIAQRQLLDFLKMSSLEGMRMIDIGCGSGIHSLAAYRAGVKELVSFDYDPDSVATTKRLHAMVGSPSNWTVKQGSILDKNYVQELGKFDVVYSWGVLHHTGALWDALKNAIGLLGAKGRMYIALYDSGIYPKGKTEYWLKVKKKYNRAGYIKRLCMEVHYFWTNVAHRQIKHIIHFSRMAEDYRISRGMDLWTDIRDWLGGWPMEFSSTEEVIRVSRQYDLQLVNLETGEANASYLFVSHEHVKELGYTPYHYEPISKIEVIESLNHVPKDMPACIFGTGAGSRILADAMRNAGMQVLSLIDLQEASEWNGFKIQSFDDFVKTNTQSQIVLIPNKHVVQNAALLLKYGFRYIYNAQPLTQKLAQQRKYKKFLAG